MPKPDRGIRFLVSFLILPFMVTPAVAYGPEPPVDGARLDLSLRKLTVLGSALYVAAHPDDENTAMLTWLENDRHLRAAYVSMTRGDGGQNLIGDEKGDLLGLIRTQELLAARRIDGAEQFFTRAIDFGYSKNPEETLSIWGRDSILADLVGVVRAFRPDVIITRFPTTGEGGHGHHTASAMLAVEAFEAAADPNRFPEQLTTLTTWKPERIFWNRFSRPGDPAPEEAGLLQVDLGAYNPQLARSYTELAADSRSMHKSQGFGSAERRGSTPNYLKLLAGSPAQTDPFEGIDLTWGRVEGGKTVGAILETAWRSFDPRNPGASLPKLLEARGALTKLQGTTAGRSEQVLLDHKSNELDEVIRSVAGLWIEAVSREASVSPGDSLHVTATVVNRSDLDLGLQSVALHEATPSGAGAVLASRDVGQPLANNTPIPAQFAIQVPAATSPGMSQPYWLRGAHTLGLFNVTDPSLFGRPDNLPVYVVRFTIASGKETLVYDTPVFHRYVDRVEGEHYRALVVEPPVTLSLDQKVYLFPDRTARNVNVTVSAVRNISGEVRLRLPQGWKATPEAAPVELGGSPRQVVFSVTPDGVNGGAPLTAEFRASTGEVYDRNEVTIDYNHIPLQSVFLPAEARLVRLDLKKNGERVGYIMGPGDEVPDNLRQAGFDVSLLSDASIESGNLALYDAIVIGVRAYNTRDALKRRQDRILDYVKEGGTVVVQYNTADNTLFQKFAPFPLKLGRDRVTVEEAPVTFLDPRSPLLNYPNAITPADFEGWVQERGLYFASEWDSTWTPVLASNDPGEPERKGGLLTARYGKGIFIYTGYAFFRQLPAGVPGAYRLFVNLVSAQ